MCTFVVVVAVVLFRFVLFHVCSFSLFVYRIDVLPDQTEPGPSVHMFCCSLVFPFAFAFFCFLAGVRGKRLIILIDIWSTPVIPLSSSCFWVFVRAPFVFVEIC